MTEPSNDLVVGAPGRLGAKRAWSGVLASALLAFSAFACGGDDADPSGNDAQKIDRSGSTATPSQSTPAQASAPANFAGTWWTNFARVEVTQSESGVSGSYSPYLADNRPRSLQGYLNGRALSGTFDGPTNRFIFELAEDGQSFTGRWIDPNGGTHEWCGRRDQRELLDGCGYSGEWKVTGFPPAAELDGTTIRITQVADMAIVELKSGRYGQVEFDAAFDAVTLAQATGTLRLIGQGATGLEVEFQWLVTSDPNWDALSGTWKSVSPAPGSSGPWCAWRGAAQAPC